MVRNRDLELLVDKRGTSSSSGLWHIWKRVRLVPYDQQVNHTTFLVSKKLHLLDENLLGGVAYN